LYFSLFFLSASSSEAVHRERHGRAATGTEKIEVFSKSHFSRVGGILFPPWGSMRLYMVSCLLKSWKWNLKSMKLIVIGLACAMACGAQTALPFELRVGDETVPPGQRVQLKLMLTDPHPISTGKTSLRLSPAFFNINLVDGVALFNPAGDVSGAAVLQDGKVSARFASSSATFGTDTDYPIMTVVVGTLPGATGTQTVAIDPGDSFWAWLGLYYFATIKPGTITAGGSLNVSNVIPGGGLVPAGFVVKLIGAGFDSDTKVQVDGVDVSVRFVSSTEIDLIPSAQTDMQGKRIRVRSKDGTQVTYFSYLRAASLGTSSRGAVLPSTIPIFSNTTTTSGYLPASSAPPNSYNALALENSNPSQQANVSLDLLSSGGQVLANSKVILPSAMRYVKEIAELFALATVPAGSGVRVSSDVPIQLLGLVTDEVASTVTPFTVSAAVQPVTASPLALRFDYRVGDPAPATLPIALAASAGTMQFTVTQLPAVSWLAVSPVTGTAPASLSVTANPSGLATGTYTTTINVTPASGIGISIPVTLTVTSQTTAAIGGIVNAANQQTGALSPGEIITVYGSFPGVPATGLALDSSGKVATSLAAMRVLFDGFPAPLTFTSATQINAVVPYEISDSGSTRVVAELAGVPSAAVIQTTTASAPAIFTANASGFGPAAVLNQDSTVNSVSNPAARGLVISIFATGEGRTAPASVTGSVSAALKNPVLPVTATIGGQPAVVSYAGSAPGLVAGVLQVNVQVPGTTAPGSAVEVIIKVGDAASRAGVTIAVQ
jgi:uncharacterized protein (TIGR03437 family)